MWADKKCYGLSRQKRFNIHKHLYHQMKYHWEIYQKDSLLVCLYYCMYNCVENNTYLNNFYGTFSFFSGQRYCNAVPYDTLFLVSSSSWYSFLVLNNFVICITSVFSKLKIWFFYSSFQVYINLYYPCFWQCLSIPYFSMVG